jgi:hypothetical protein
MARLIRKCTQCGALDQAHAWTSMDDAADKGAWDESWTCGSCAWTEFELTEADEEPARA